MHCPYTQVPRNASRAVVCSRLATTARSLTANRYPASCIRQEKSTSSPAERVSLKPADASKASLRTARFPPRAYGRNPICVVATGTGFEWARPCRDPKSKTPATRSAPSRVATIPASQPGRTTSSASQKTRIRPPAVPTPMLRAAPGPGRAEASTSRTARVTLGPLLHTGAGAVCGAVVRHDDFPFARRFLHTQGRKLLLHPRHSIEHRHDHADQRAVACILLVRHADGFHDCCLTHRDEDGVKSQRGGRASPLARREHSRSTRWPGRSAAHNVRARICASWREPEGPEERRPHSFQTAVRYGVPTRDYATRTVQVPCPSVPCTVCTWPLWFSALWGLAFTCFPCTVALRTGGPAAVNACNVVFFPLFFLTDAVGPKRLLTGCFSTMTSDKPVTYLLGALRALITSGWNARPLLEVPSAYGCRPNAPRDGSAQLTLAIDRRRRRTLHNLHRPVVILGGDQPNIAAWCEVTSNRYRSDTQPPRDHRNCNHQMHNPAGEVPTGSPLRATS